MKKIFLFAFLIFLSREALAQIDTLFVEILGDTVRIHNNVEDLTCNTRFVLDVAIANDSIHIFERDTSTAHATCLCGLNVTVSMAGLSPGTYFVNVIRKTWWTNPSDTIQSSVGSLSFTIGSFSSQNWMQTRQWGCGVDIISHIESERPPSFLLLENYPNPFNPGTTIRYSIPSPELVNLKVFDLLGREVATLVDEQKAAGSYEVSFDPRRAYSSGVYFCHLTAGRRSKTVRMLFAK